MKRPEKLDKALVLKIRKEIETALNCIAEQNGLHSISTPRGISFSPYSFDLMVRIALKSGHELMEAEIKSKTNTDVVTTTSQIFLLSAAGLPTDLVGKKMLINKLVVTILEYKTAYPKYPIIGITNTAKKYKFSVEQVKKGRLLNSPAEATTTVVA